jgi:hypothetical protein
MSSRDELFRKLNVFIEKTAILGLLTMELFTELMIIFYLVSGYVGPSFRQVFICLKVIICNKLICQSCLLPHYQLQFTFKIVMTIELP